jgi:hypothetical protein
MPDESEFAEVLAETATDVGRDSFTPAEHARLKAAVFSEPFSRLVTAERSYFVLGNYDDGPREDRLLAVRAALDDRDGAFAFLMKDVPDAWEFWPTKFRILARRAGTIVPVLEDSLGSHQWELGHVAQPKFRDRVHVLKREYDTEAAEHEHFSAMASQFVDLLARDGQVTRWHDPATLDEAVAGVP